MTDQPMNEARAREIVAKYTGKVWGGFRPEPPHELIRSEGFLASLEAGRIGRDKWRSMAERLAEAIRTHRTDLCFCLDMKESLAAFEKVKKEGGNG